jgi:hypothetical protein
MQTSTAHILKRIERILSVEMPSVEMPQSNFTVTVNLSVDGKMGGVYMNQNNHFRKMIYGSGDTWSDISSLAVNVSFDSNTTQWIMQIGQSLFIANNQSLKYDLRLNKPWTVKSYRWDDLEDTSHPMRSITFYVNHADTVKFIFSRQI